MRNLTSSIDGLTVEFIPRHDWMMRRPHRLIVSATDLLKSVNWESASSNAYTQVDWLLTGFCIFTATTLSCTFLFFANVWSFWFRRLGRGLGEHRHARSGMRCPCGRGLIDDVNKSTIICGTKGFSVWTQSNYAVHCKGNIYAATGSQGGDVSLNSWCNEPSISRIQDVFQGPIPGTSLSATWRDLSSDNMRKRSC